MHKVGNAVIGRNIIEVGFVRAGAGRLGNHAALAANVSSCVRHRSEKTAAGLV